VTGADEEGIDYATNLGGTLAKNPSDLAGSGYSFVGRYIGGAAPYFSSSDAQTLLGEGVSVVSIFETNPNHLSYFTSSQGISDGEAAYDAATQYENQPSGTAIYFTVDYDPGMAPSEQAALLQIQAYFQGVEQGMTDAYDESSFKRTYSIGAYGAGDVLRAVVGTTTFQAADGGTITGNGIAQFGWLAGASAWVGTSTYSDWTIKQQVFTPFVTPTSPNIINTGDGYTFDGTQIDFDQTSGAGFGQWPTTGSSTQLPVVVADGPFTVAVGGSGTITSSDLDASDTGYSPSALTYTITSGPSYGTLFDNGVASGHFTQADIDAGWVTYQEGGDNVSSDSFFFQLTDTGGNFTTDSFPVDVQGSPPVLSGGGNTVSYRSTGSAVAVDTGLAVTDTSATTLAGATVTISSGPLPDDTLSFTSLYGITGSYNSTTGALALSGLATLTEYDVVLDSVTFSSTAVDATNGGIDNSRTISWSVNADQSSSTAVISTIDVYPSAPPPGEQPYVDTNAFPVIPPGSFLFITGNDLHVTDPNPSFPTDYNTTLINSAITYTVVQAPEHGLLVWDTAYPTLYLSGPSWYGQEVTKFTQNDLQNGWVEYTNQGASQAFDSFSFTVSDGYGGTIGLTTATLQIACFASGTRIATVEGEIAVEDLFAGDHVRTISGGTPPVVWLGHRTVQCRRHRHPERVWPVRISAGAFGPDMPRCDLWLSPDHAVLVMDVLIPIKHLINDKSIVQVPMDEVTYYHIELPEHDVLLAEGLPVESYLDVGDRSKFANGDGVIRLFPAILNRPIDVAIIWEAKGCAPLVVWGPELTAVRQWVNALAAVVTDHGSEIHSTCLVRDSVRAA
jgi:hypothetical protein